MEPPDENLIAIIATTASFLVVVPFLIKWWPQVRAKARETSKRPDSGSRTAKPAMVAVSAAATTVADRAPRATGRRRGGAGVVVPRRSREENKVMRPGQSSDARMRTPRPTKDG